MTPWQWARVLQAGSKAAKTKTLAEALAVVGQQGYAALTLHVVLDAMSREAELIAGETR